MEPSERLKDVRTELRLNQKDLSDAIGIKQPYYSEMERGIKKVTSNLLNLLFVHFQVSSNYILNGVEPKFISNRELPDEHLSEHFDEHFYQNSIEDEKDKNSGYQSVSFKSFKRKYTKAMTEFREEFPELNEIIDLIVRINREAEKINICTLRLQDDFSLIISDINLETIDNKPEEQFKAAIHFLSQFKNQQESLNDFLVKLKEIRVALNKVISNS